MIKIIVVILILLFPINVNSGPIVYIEAAAGGPSGPAASNLVDMTSTTYEFSMTGTIPDLSGDYTICMIWRPDSTSVSEEYNSLLSQTVDGESDDSIILIRNANLNGVNAVIWAANNDGTDPAISGNFTYSAGTDVRICIEQNFQTDITDCDFNFYVNGSSIGSSSSHYCSNTGTILGFNYVEYSDDAGTGYSGDLRIWPGTLKGATYIADHNDCQLNTSATGVGYWSIEESSSPASDLYSTYSDMVAASGSSIATGQNPTWAGDSGADCYQTP